MNPLELHIQLQQETGRAIQRRLITQLASHFDVATIRRIIKKAAELQPTGKIADVAPAIRALRAAQ